MSDQLLKQFYEYQKIYFLGEKTILDSGAFLE